MTSRPGRAAGILAASYAAGSVPFSQLAARAATGDDLRRVGSGTVSGSALYELAGFGPLAAAGVFEVAKGALGPLLAGRGRPWLAAAAAGAAIAGHNWSPWLGWAGGRGLSPALGATAVVAPEGTAVLLGAMAAGRLVRHSGAVTLLGVLALAPVLRRRRGPAGAALGLAVAAPMLAKRLAGNGPPPRRPRGAALLARALFDRDPPARYAGCACDPKDASPVAVVPSGAGRVPSR